MCVRDCRGLGLAWILVQGGDPTHGMLPVFMLPARDLALGLALWAGPAGASTELGLGADWWVSPEGGGFQLTLALDTPLAKALTIGGRFGAMVLTSPNDFGVPVDLRVSTLPASMGEKVVIRVLDSRATVLSLDNLGLNPDERSAFEALLTHHEGIILVTGPTGSGKTTTLYSAIRTIQSGKTNIVTVEDPVEYQIPGINQVQVDEKAKKSFPAALRAILRQDPDVIMVGEIRDKETAQIAFRASITGHLVLTTVHTNDAPSAVTRLVDLGLEPFMVASALVGVVSMRLVRTLCQNCKEPHTALPEIVRQMGLARFTQDSEITLYQPKGCPQCAQTGYSGRISIMEMLPVTDPLRSLVMKHATATELRNEAIREGMLTMYEDGLRKAVRGITTFEEVLRVTRES